MALGRRLRVLSVVDAFTRQCHSLEADTSFPQPPRGARAGSSHRPQDRRAARPPRQAHRERLCGKFPRKAAQRMPEHKLALEPVRRKEENWSVAAGVQLHAAPLALVYMTPNQCTLAWNAVLAPPILAIASAGLPDQASATFQPDRQPRWEQNAL